MRQPAQGPALTRYGKLLAVWAAAGVLAVTAGCAADPDADSTGVSASARSRVTASDRVYHPDDLKNAGMKLGRAYDVSELSGATAAVNGFLNRKEYEARFYANFADASGVGAAAASLVTGKDAAVTGKVPWEEGATDRRKCVGAINANCVAKYGDFVVYGNLVLLCEGRDSATSLDTCFELISLLTK